MDEDILKIKISGEIKNDVAHEFEDEIMAALTVCHKIELDFENVTYIASMALRSLLSAQQMIDEINDSQMVITHANSSIMEIFDESGFTEILLIKGN